MRSPTHYKSVSSYTTIEMLGARNPILRHLRDDPGRRRVLLVPQSSKEVVSAVERDDVSARPPAAPQATTYQRVYEMRRGKITDVVVNKSKDVAVHETAMLHGTTIHAGMSSGAQASAAWLSSLFLPPGFPESVTPDYLPYQLWAVPTHVFGSLCHALTTSSLLGAVGISAGPAATTAASAAIRWITKDGLGGLGRFVVGSRLGGELDDDPRFWRLFAEAMSTVGMALEIATGVYPQHFLVLASLGHLCISVGRTMGKPVFRIIQNHFASSNNIGAVSAKEEVWEVTAQVAGYTASLAVLHALDTLLIPLTSDGEGRVADGALLLGVLWASCQGLHIALRVTSLKVLVFTSLSEKRARMLLSSHMRGQPLEPPEVLNRQEPVFLPVWLGSMQPRVHLSTHSVEGALLGPAAGSDALAPALDAALGLYAREEYVLAWRGGEAYVVLREGAGPRASLRALYQATWLHQHTQQSAGLSAGPVGQQEGASSEWQCERHVELLSASLQAMDAGMQAFEKEARQLGWTIEAPLIKAGDVRIAVQ